MKFFRWIIMTRAKLSSLQWSAYSSGRDDEAEDGLREEEFRRYGE